MDGTEHQYRVSVHWTGNLGQGTSGYRAYSRDHIVSAEGMPTLAGSADATFHGARDRWNPEQLLLAALSQCHMLSYLHLAVLHSVNVSGYRDEATGTMQLNRDHSGQFTSATLYPQVSLVDESQRELADSLHAQANKVCFIARSVNFPVHHEPLAPTDQES
ncbi:OsmC family protein [Glutamicibacter sp. PS]|uniref:OsmC family protein n=1 Tax=Glutamicibacter sp. PS TaxID=3075634 RepID=UPI002848BD3E|nr:OsmC family protein [Glutamicibacter sp. PS]MDR4532593.1 OsmC family protein [Glutamicibacter sp. PS]